jgi:hypothetical protein
MKIGCPDCSNLAIKNFEIEEFNLSSVTATTTCENGHKYIQTYTYE